MLGKKDLSRFPDRLSVIWSLLGLAVVCAVESEWVSGIYYGGSAPPVPLLVGYVSAFILLPYSFAYFFWGAFDPGGTFLHVFLPWYGVVVFLFRRLFMTRNVLYFVVISIIMILSSWDLVFATANLFSL